MEILKNFAVFEGIDGSGTTTQLSMLEAFFQQNKRSFPPFYKTFEPTNGSIGKLIRSCLRNETPLSPVSMALLFAADRNEHIYGSEGINERCKRGELVVSDRYLLSSLVYQGLLCGEELPARLNQDFPRPELLLFFDLEPEIALERISGRRQREIYENLDFQVQVRRRYKDLLPALSSAGVSVEILDASRPAEEIAADVLGFIQKMPIING